MTRAQNSIRGSKAKSAGARFEALLEMHHDIAKRLGILAHVAKNEPKATFVGGRLIYTSAGVSDFTGTLFGGGTLAVEAKSREGRLMKSDVEPLQQRHLNAVAAAGGNALALLLVEFREKDGNMRFAIPWLEVPWQVKRTAESLGLDDLRVLHLYVSQWLIHNDECYLEKFHPRGTPSIIYDGRKRVFARK